VQKKILDNKKNIFKRTHVCAGDTGKTEKAEENEESALRRSPKEGILCGGLGGGIDRGGLRTGISLLV